MLKQAVRTATTTAVSQEKRELNSGQILYQTHCTVTDKSAKKAFPK